MSLAGVECAIGHPMRLAALRPGDLLRVPPTTEKIAGRYVKLGPTTGDPSIVGKAEIIYWGASIAKYWG